MSTLSDDSLVLKIEQHVESEEYRLALDSIEQIRKKKLDIDVRLRMGVLESRCWTGLAEFSKAFTIAQEVVEEGTKSQEYNVHVIEGLLEMASASWDLGQPDVILEKCSQAEKLSQKLTEQNESLLESIRADILLHQSPGWYFKDDVHKAIECVEESVSINERLGNIPGVIAGLMRLGYLSFEVDYDQTIKHQEKGLELNKELGLHGHVIFGLCCQALIEINRNNWSEAEQLIQQSLDLADENDHRRWMLFILFNSAFLYTSRGDFELAEKAYREYFTWTEKAGAKMHSALASNNLGEIYRARGDFEKALKCYERSMKYNKDIGRTKGQLIGLTNIGLVQYARGNLDEALILLEESLALAEKQKQAGLLGGYNITYDSLFIISILIDKGIINEAHKRLERIRQIRDETKADYDQQTYQIAKALVLKSSMLPKDILKAKEYLTDVVDGSFFDIEISVFALLHLTELLVNELRITGNPDVLSSLETRLTRLHDIASEQGSTLLSIETQLLQSRVALLNLEADRANQLLVEAQQIAEEKGLTEISKRISTEQKALATELSFLEELSGDGTSMAERAEKIRIHEHIGEMIQQGLWRKMLF
ncbi:MAG: tetratricopeptide repeat protein [Candidatus Thorarchaeota archaeon]|jgi:tetratricopeptide (TPR) repeat protein